MNDELDRAGVVVGLVRRLRDAGNWAGATHVQKACYLLKELAGVPLGYDFVLYKHGPYGFEFSDELGGMRARGFLELQPQPSPYGPKLAATELGERVENEYSPSAKTYAKQLDWVAEAIGDKGVVELERLTTALYVTRQPDSPEDPEGRARKLSELKPHIPLEVARAAVEEVDQLIVKAQGL